MYEASAFSICNTFAVVQKNGMGGDAGWKRIFQDFSWFYGALWLFLWPLRLFPGKSDITWYSSAVWRFWELVFSSGSFAIMWKDGVLQALYSLPAIQHCLSCDFPACGRYRIIPSAMEKKLWAFWHGWSHYISYYAGKSGKKRNDDNCRTGRCAVQ